MAQAAAWGFPCHPLPSLPVDQDLHSQPPAVSPAPRLSLTLFAISSLSLLPLPFFSTGNAWISPHSPLLRPTAGMMHPHSPQRCFGGSKKVGFGAKITFCAVLELGNELVL